MVSPEIPHLIRSWSGTWWILGTVGMRWDHTPRWDASLSQGRVVMPPTGMFIGGRRKSENPPEETHSDMGKSCETPHIQKAKLRFEMGTLELSSSNVTPCTSSQLQIPGFDSELRLLCKILPISMWVSTEFSGLLPPPKTSH